MAEKKYRCLNPVGTIDPFDLYPISPRLDKLDGKTIYFSIGAGGEQDIIIPLTKRLQTDYPQVNWQITHRCGTPHHRRQQRSVRRRDEGG